ncbi:hypothetical protein PYW07_007792 [Mythimna separata]|uniref:CUB domain-containing protein n=1 Tax=Mythimna separata TaxID=271217 RepID=A0AAD8DUB2_MYTSE|nr:hypothetical protein PYW07_007792 [Mythimna separata]
MADGSLTASPTEQCNALANAFSMNMSLTTNWTCDPGLQEEVSNSMLVSWCLLGLALLSVCAERAYAQQRHSEHQGPQTCGGHLTRHVGTITTPNFPNPFPVPIKCKWIIEHDIVNGTISVYFTQQYTTTGLTFTEYMYYDESYKLGERRALTVTDDNITRIKWLQVGHIYLASPDIDKSTITVEPKTVYNQRTNVAGHKPHNHNIYKIRYRVRNTIGPRGGNPFLMQRDQEFVK